ncbi:MAG: flagellar hook protein [Verrucomicrobia bacterium]|nr:flagellar hook protein [Verrucomicrobiota bacterium]
MSGIQISGLLSNSAFDWKSVVDQLIAADSIPITTLTAQKTANTDKVTALASLKTSLADLQESLQTIRAGNLFSSRNVSSDTTGTTWKSNSASGATIGAYKFAVQQLATASRLQGGANIGSGLATTSDVSGLTIANLNVGTAVTAGNFTVNGKTVAVALTDSLQDVFDKIHTATGNDVTATYDPTSDHVTLHSATTHVVLGASNDASNFLTVMKLGNNDTDTVESSALLGTLKLSNPIISSGLSGAITAVDPSGNGSFTINGVNIAYNVNTDSVSAVMSRINKAGAGVTASYDFAGDRMTLTNNTTGDVGMGATEATGGLLDALGLSTAATLTRGKNALFTVNDGAVLTSASNTLDASVHGVTGLSVIVNTKSTQTVNVESDTASMTSAIQDFLDKFNAVQNFIETNSKTTVSGTTVSTSILSDNREVQNWATQLRALAFDQVSGLTGTVSRFDNLGIDFDSTSGTLTIKNADKLATALADHPDDVQAFFLTPSTGLVSKGYTYLTSLISADSDQQERINQQSSDIDAQIATMQTRLTAERDRLTTSFIQMLDAQSTAQSQNTTLTNAFFSNNNN